jgi:hypothetical protein
VSKSAHAALHAGFRGIPAVPDTTQTPPGQLQSPAPSADSISNPVRTRTSTANFPRQTPSLLDARYCSLGGRVIWPQ